MYTLYICDKCCDTGKNSIPSQMFTDQVIPAFNTWLERVNSVANPPKVMLTDLSIKVCREKIESYTQVGDDWRSDRDTLITYCFYTTTLTTGQQTALGIDSCIEVLVPITSDDIGGGIGGSSWDALVEEVDVRLDFDFGVSETKTLSIPVDTINCTMNDFSTMYGLVDPSFTVETRFNYTTSNIDVEVAYDGVLAAGTYGQEQQWTSCNRTQSQNIVLKIA